MKIQNVIQTFNFQTFRTNEPTNEPTKRTNKRTQRCITVYTDFVWTSQAFEESTSSGNVVSKVYRACDDDDRRPTTCVLVCVGWVTFAGGDWRGDDRPAADFVVVVRPFVLRCFVVASLLRRCFMASSLLPCFLASLLPCFLASLLPCFLASLLPCLRFRCPFPFRRLHVSSAVRDGRRCRCRGLWCCCIPVLLYHTYTLSTWFV